MDWKNCKIEIKKDNPKSEELYNIFRSMGVVSEKVLIALCVNHASNKVTYSVLVLDDKRNCGIIGGEEMYYWNNCTIVGYMPIEEIPENWCTLHSNKLKSKSDENFKGVIYQNGTVMKGYNNAEALFDDYDSLMEILITNNGQPVFQESDEKEGTAVFYNVSTYKPSSISFKTNR